MVVELQTCDMRPRVKLTLKGEEQDKDNCLRDSTWLHGIINHLGKKWEKMCYITKYFTRWSWLKLERNKRRGKTISKLRHQLVCLLIFASLLQKGLRGMRIGVIRASCCDSPSAKMLQKEQDHCLFLHLTMQTDSYLLYCLNIALLVFASRTGKLGTFSLKDEGIEFYDCAICIGIFTEGRVATYSMGGGVLYSSRCHFLAVKRALCWQAVNLICDAQWTGHSALSWGELNDCRGKSSHPISASASTLTHHSDILSRTWRKLYFLGCWYIEAYVCKAVPLLCPTFNTTLKMHKAQPPITHLL